VLWGADYLPDLLALAGDVGGRALLARHADCVHEVEMPDDAVLIDIDQPGDLAALLADPAPGPRA
jgi:CTP:molybdopterin cytidylyltransferase MocA